VPSAAEPPAEPAPPPTAEPEPEPEVTASAESSAEATSNAAGEVVITGSRIRDAVGKQAPVTTLSANELAKTGLYSVGDILQRLPASGSAINGTTNLSGNSGNPPDGGGVGAGATEMDLRSLGSKRVLVLVDGVRWVNGSSASGVAGAVDLNTIPLNMIERIEVLEDGASPIYGSDAIAGVVNIITRKNFHGAQANGYVGGFVDKGDGFTQKYDLTFGNTLGRLSIVAGASYLDQRQVRSADREISNSPIPTLDKCEAGCSSGTPQGRIIFLDPMTMEGTSVTLNTGVGGMPRYPEDYHPFTAADRFNYSPYNLVLTPSRRISAFSSVIYRFTDSLNFHGKTTFTHRESVNQAAPEPLFVGPEGGTGTNMDLLSIDAANPYNPFGFSFTPRSPYGVLRRPLEAGPRRFEQTVNTFYVAGGLDGTYTFGDKRFIWDTTVAYSINHALQRRKNAFNSAKLSEALGPGFMGMDGKLHCGTMQNPGRADCVPFNIFGGQGADGRGTITREMLDYVTYTQHDVSEQRLFDWTANTSGPIVNLPAGPLAVGVGIEHRRLEGYFEPDAVVAAGDSADIPAKPTSGRYNVSEAYAEARIPVLARIPAISLLDLNAAGRVSKYSFLDPELTGRFGGRWKPLDDLVVRASYGVGFRAPSIGELFGTQSRYDATMSDPCSDYATRPGVTDALRQRCMELQIPATYMQNNPQISVLTGGNRDLQPERSKSLNLSIAYAPAALQDRTWSDRLDLELAYWQISISGAIAALDAQRQIDGCVAGDSTLCQGITRISTGGISSFRNQLRNLAGIETRGIDFKLNYQTSMLPLGRLRARWLSSYLIDFWEKIPTAMGTDTLKREGKVAGEPERAYPQLKSNLTLEWLVDDFDFALVTRYIHQLTEPCRDLAELDMDLCSDYNTANDDLSTNRLGVKVYNDVRITWNPSFDDKLTVSVGVNNIFNVEPPICYSCALNGFTGGTYNVPGVFGYLSAGYTMQ
jgi:iron complex outermembrane recepter protein